MTATIIPAKLSGTFKAITSKSYAHRVLICSALSGEMIDTTQLDLSEDIQATINCLNALETCDKPLLDCGESGATFRFLLPTAAALKDQVSFTGRGNLPNRPILPLIRQMNAHGCKFSADSLPFTVTGKLESGEYSLPADITSQFITGLLTALPLLDGDSSLTLTSDAESKGYIDMTLKILSDFGIAIKYENNCGGNYLIKGGQKYVMPQAINIERDWSNSAYLLALNSLGCDITAEWLSADSVQGDKQITRYIADFPNVIDVSDIPDLFQILAVMACAVKGETLLKNARRLRFKESDRIRSTAALIEAFGGTAIEAEDSLTIIGKGYLDGGTVDALGDHRIVMTACAASVISRNTVTIKHAEAINKSYPDYFNVFDRLGGNVSLTD
jgi:3-phosphoshikimate 1-carboxyvinyltransferase